MTIDKINPAEIAEALNMLQKKLPTETVVGTIAKGKYQNKMSKYVTKLVNYSIVFILIGTIVSIAIWLMRY
jgi:hypothetical protein